MKSVKAKETREVKLVHAAQQDGRPLGTTTGTYKVEGAQIVMLRESANALLIDLTVLGLGSYGDAEWTWTTQLFEPPGLSTALPPAPATSTWSGCKIMGVEESQEQGSDELITTFDIQPLVVTKVVAGVNLQLWSAIRQLLP